MRIKQRPAGVPGIDGRVGLNRAFDLSAILGANGTLQTANDAGRQRAIKSKRIANRQHLLADNQFVRVAQRHRGNRFSRSLQKSNHRQVSIGILTHDFSGILSVAAKIHSQLFGVGDNVIVRENVALVVDNRTRSGAFSGF